MAGVGYVTGDVKPACFRLMRLRAMSNPPCALLLPISWSCHWAVGAVVGTAVGGWFGLGWIGTLLAVPPVVFESTVVVSPWSDR